MKSAYRPILVFGAVLSLCACQEKPAIEQEPDAEELAEPQPRTAAPVPAELLPAEDAEAETPTETTPSESLVKNPAQFDTIELIRTAEGPALRLTGHLPDGATRLLPPEQSTREGVLHISVMMARDPQAIGTMALVPFDITIPLPDPPPAQIMLNGQPVLGDE